MRYRVVGAESNTDKLHTTEEATCTRLQSTGGRSMIARRSYSTKLTSFSETEAYQEQLEGAVCWRKGRRELNTSEEPLGLVVVVVSVGYIVCDTLRKSASFFSLYGQSRAWKNVINTEDTSRQQRRVGERAGPKLGGKLDGHAKVTWLVLQPKLRFAEAEPSFFQSTNVGTNIQQKRFKTILKTSNNTELVGTITRTQPKSVSAKIQETPEDPRRGRSTDTQPCSRQCGK